MRVAVTFLVFFVSFALADNPDLIGNKQDDPAMVKHGQENKVGNALIWYTF